MFVTVDYVRKMTVKKSCKYGEYGSLEHLLILPYLCSRDSHYRSDFYMLLLHLERRRLA